jgi:hypothetical protein
MNRATLYSTVIVISHALVSLIHGVAHSQLQIDLSPAQMWFVLLVIGLCPLVAMGLLWTSQKTSGLILLVLSMAGSLMFGLFGHFLVMGPDHVGEQMQGPWATTFALTAYGVLITEVLGVLVGLRFLLPNREEEEAS